MDILSSDIGVRDFGEGIKIQACSICGSISLFISHEINRIDGQ